MCPGLAAQVQHVHTWHEMRLACQAVMQIAVDELHGAALGVAVHHQQLPDLDVICHRVQVRAAQLPETKLLAQLEPALLDLLIFLFLQYWQSS